MSDDKITVSWDEINAEPQSPTPPQSISIQLPEVKQKKSNGLVFVLIGVIILLVLGIVGFTIYHFSIKKAAKEARTTEVVEHQKTVEEWQKEFTAGLSDEIKNDAILKNRIEQAHGGTITVTSSNITKITTTTIDGSNFSGKNGENIATVEVDITFRWDGVFHKNGYTILTINFDIQNDRITSSYIKDTDAIINYENEQFWSDLGFLIGVGLL